MENTSVFQQLTEQVSKTEQILEEFNQAVENFVGLNGSGDGLRKKLKQKIKTNKKLQKVCNESKKR